MSSKSQIILSQKTTSPEFVIRVMSYESAENGVPILGTFLNLIFLFILLAITPNQINVPRTIEGNVLYRYILV